MHYGKLSKSVSINICSQFYCKQVRLAIKWYQECIQSMVKCFRRVLGDTNMTHTSTTGIYGGWNPQDVPAYTLAEAARYLHIAAATPRSWVFGRSYPLETGKGCLHCNHCRTDKCWWVHWGFSQGLRPQNRWGWNCYYLRASSLSIVFFTDRDLDLQFPTILRTAGLVVERHADHFHDTAKDEEWLLKVGLV